jgi:hypothetical protein
MPDHIHANEPQNKPKFTRKMEQLARTTVSEDSVQQAIETPTPDTLTPDVISRLQTSHGNRFVNRLIQRMNEALPIQTKMTVTAADDKYEKEADAMADAVTRKIDESSVQREGDEEEMMMERDTIQRDDMDDDDMMMKRDTIQRDDMDDDDMMMKRDTIQRDDMDDDDMMMKRQVVQRADFDAYEGGDVGSDVEQQIDSARGGGQAIDDSVRAPMESAFGADFSGVRVHTDSTSDQLNNAVQAKAFTTGNDIFFKQGEYNPGSSDGQKLLAHELTHTIQQGAAGPQKKDEE